MHAEMQVCLEELYAYKQYLQKTEADLLSEGARLKSLETLEWNDTICDRAFAVLTKLIDQTNRVIQEINININILQHQIKIVEAYFATKY